MIDPKDYGTIDKNDLVREIYRLEGEYAKIRHEWMQAFKAHNKPLLDQIAFARDIALLRK